MKLERLLELAGAPVTESVDPNKEYVAMSYTFKDIEELLKDYLADGIADGDYPEGSEINLTDKMAERWADLMGDAYSDLGGNNVADAEIEITDDIIKKVVNKKGK